MGRTVKIFFLRHKEYMPTVIALLLWILFGIGHWAFGWTIIPFGYVTSFLYGLIGAQLFTGALLWWMSVTLPHLRKRLDSDNEKNDESKLTEWQLTLKALIIFGFLFFGSIWLAGRF